MEYGEKKSKIVRNDDIESAFHWVYTRLSTGQLYPEKVEYEDNSVVMWSRERDGSFFNFLAERDYGWLKDEHTDGSTERGTNEPSEQS